METGPFVAFYDLYPKHVDRTEAAEVWNAGKLDLKAVEIMAGLAVQLADLRAREPKHVRSPARWLRKGNWADDAGAYATAPQNANGAARHTLPKSAGNRAVLERFLAKGETT